jgi:two-component system sensor histidine kinase YesM
MNSKFVFAICLVCMIAAIMSAYFLSRIIANPIAKLTVSAQAVKSGMLEMDLEGLRESNDEVGILATTFIEMVGKIKELLEKTKTDDKKKREFELALLQSQIKPHFLYNAIDLIYVCCEMGKPQKAATVAKSLAGFYESFLSKGKEVITIADELKNVKDYLVIQKERYSDVLDYSISADEAVLGKPILKMTIQPLVENAIYHGIKPKGAPGGVVVEVSKDGGNIVVRVKDDGVGISEAALRRLLERDKSPGGSFGLKSVDERIKLYFGGVYGLKMTSAPGQGTTAEIVMPEICGDSAYA